MDERQIPGRKLRRIVAQFNTNERRLEILSYPTVSFEDQAAAFFADERFYVLNKKQFEQAAGLEQEFETAAIEIIQQAGASELVVGLNLAEAEIRKSSRLLKRLANVERDLAVLTPERIEEMLGVCERYGFDLKMEDGKIKIENSEDLNLFVELVEDYYLTSTQTGRDYGARAKRRIQRRNR